MKYAFIALALLVASCNVSYGPVHATETVRSCINGNSIKRDVENGDFWQYSVQSYEGFWTQLPDDINPETFCA